MNDGDHEGHDDETRNEMASASLAALKDAQARPRVVEELVLLTLRLGCTECRWHIERTCVSESYPKVCDEMTAALDQHVRVGCEA